MGTEKQKPANDGFTIIEVLIVLAIVGLILLIVFLAVPTLKRVERNNYRKQQAVFALSQMDFYRNERNKFPETETERCTFIKDYLASVKTVTCTNVGGTKNCVLGQMERLKVCFRPYDGLHDYVAGENEDEIAIEFGHWCNRPPHYDPGSLYIMSTTALHDKTKFAIWTQLEKGPVYCVDNAPN